MRFVQLLGNLPSSVREIGQELVGGRKRMDLYPESHRTQLTLAGFIGVVRFCSSYMVLSTL